MLENKIESISIRGYARTLYDNYRARVQSSGQSLPDWKHASPFVKREFMKEARQLLS